MDEKPLVALVGPTASGKTALAAALSRRIGGEVVTADSMQVYRGMDVGTAKPGVREQGGAPHHMIDVADPSETYSVHRYAQDAAACIAGIHSRGRIPILSGGTGLYVDAALYPLRFTGAGVDEAYRRTLSLRCRLEGPESLHRQLAREDPASAAAIHPNNVKRVIRALEVHHLTGIPLSQYADARQVRWRPFACFGLAMPRDALYRRIDRRVDAMMARGLADEVKRLLDTCPGWSETARQALGYKELVEYLEGRCALDEAVDRLKRRTRHYAKRQMTWFARMKDVEWLQAENRTEEQIIDDIRKKLIEKFFVIV